MRESKIGQREPKKKDIPKIDLKKKIKATRRIYTFVRRKMRNSKR